MGIVAVGGEVAVGPIPPVQAGGCPGPQVPVVVRVDGQDSAVKGSRPPIAGRGGVRLSGMEYLAGGAIVAIQPVPETSPEHPRDVLADGKDLAPRVHVDEGFCFPVKAVQPTTPSQPEGAIAVLKDHADIVKADRGGVARIFSVHGESVAVVAVEAAVGCDPQEALAILQDVTNNGEGQTIGRRYAFKARRENG